LHGARAATLASDRPATGGSASRQPSDQGGRRDRPGTHGAYRVGDLTVGRHHDDRAAHRLGPHDLADEVVGDLAGCREQQAYAARGWGRDWRLAHRAVEHHRDLGPGLGREGGKVAVSYRFPATRRRAVTLLVSVVRAGAPDVATARRVRVDAAAGTVRLAAHGPVVVQATAFSRRGTRSAVSLARLP